MDQLPKPEVLAPMDFDSSVERRKRLMGVPERLLRPQKEPCVTAKIKALWVRLMDIAEGTTMKYERLEIYPTANGKFVVRTERGESFAFDTVEEVLEWLKSTGLRK